MKNALALSLFFALASLAFPLSGVVKEYDYSETDLKEMAENIFAEELEKQEIEQAFTKASEAVDSSDLPSEVKGEMHSLLEHFYSDQLNTIGDTGSYGEIDLPDTLILGCVEILLGSFIYFCPGCGCLGQLVIADGVRRGFNGLEQMDVLEECD